jgi:hypothetical protein
MNFYKFVCVFVLLIGPLGGWNLAEARSLGGHCKNWMTTSLANENTGMHDAEATKLACAALRKSGDFKTDYLDRANTCLICSIDDWTPAQKEPTEATASKVDGDTSGASGSVHPCADSTIHVSAYWKFYGTGGGGGAKYAEKAGFVCSTKRYQTYSGNLWKTFVCDKGWVNCRFKKEVPITKIVNKGKYTGYHFGKGRDRASRTPTNLVKRGE